MFIYFSSMSILVSEQMPFPFIARDQSLRTFIVATVGVVLFLLARIVSGEESKPLVRTNIGLQTVFGILCGLALVFGWTKHRFTHTHPIDLLIHKGSVHYDKFVGQAGASKTLEAAVTAYRTRYHQHPPP